MCCLRSRCDKSEPKIKPAVPPLLQAEAFPCSVASLRRTLLFKALEAPGLLPGPNSYSKFGVDRLPRIKQILRHRVIGIHNLNTGDFPLQASAIPGPDELCSRELYLKQRKSGRESYGFRLLRIQIVIKPDPRFSISKFKLQPPKIGSIKNIVQMLLFVFNFRIKNA